MGSNKGKDSKSTMDSGKYARYTTEQVETLERVYSDCPKPSSARRQQIIREFPILANVGQKQLKVWFQNRRCREKQQKETYRLQSWASKLNSMHQLLLEENDRLQKHAAYLSSENQLLRQQFNMRNPHVYLNPRVTFTTTYDTSSESVVTSRRHLRSPQPAPQGWSVSQLSSLAEMTLADFLAKASGGMVNGIPLPGMKPGPDSIRAVAFPCTGGGVSAQACDHIDLEAFKVADIVKDRASWLQDCRKQVIVASFPADRGGMIELVHTQMYAPMPAVAAWDFWTLRYTCCLENGNLVVCEISLVGDQSLPEVLNLPGFIRAEILPSGVLIKPCDQGGSMVMAVDDWKFLPGRLSEGLHPLYETSTVFAWRVTFKVLCYLHGLAGEQSEIGAANREVSLMQIFSHRLVRGINDTINCFPDDGWIAVVNDVPSTISVYINPSQSFKHASIKGEGTAVKRGLICAKASLPLQNLSSSLVMHLLREHWTTWADANGDVMPADSFSRENVHDVPKKKSSVVKVFQPAFGQTEVLKVIRLHKMQNSTANTARQGDGGDRFLLQLSSDMKHTMTDTHAQLIFAHIDASMPDNAHLLPSGFRILRLNPHADSLSSSQTLDLAVSEERSTACRLNEFKLDLTIVLQYEFEMENRDLVVLKAQQNVQTILEFFHQATVSLHPPSSLPMASLQSGMEAMLLVQNITNSYRIHFGQELLPCSDGNAAGLFRLFWSFQPAIVCCAWRPLPEFVLANKSALEMLDTSPSALREMSLVQTLKDLIDFSQPPPFLKEEGCGHLPAGICLTSAGCPVVYEHATGWKVIVVDESVHIVAFLFLKWSVR